MGAKDNHKVWMEVIEGDFAFFCGDTWTTEVSSNWITADADSSLSLEEMMVEIQAVIDRTERLG